MVHGKNSAIMRIDETQGRWRELRSLLTRKHVAYLGLFVRRSQAPIRRESRERPWQWWDVERGEEAVGPAVTVTVKG
jgi:hypothetical protein